MPEGGPVARPRPRSPGRAELARWPARGGRDRGPLEVQPVTALEVLRLALAAFAVANVAGFVALGLLGRAEVLAAWPDSRSAR